MYLTENTKQNQQVSFKYFSGQFQFHYCKNFKTSTEKKGSGH